MTGVGGAVTVAMTMFARLFSRYSWRNRLQSFLLITALFSIAGLSGYLFTGMDGAWVAIAACFVALVVEPTAATRLTLRLYRARPIGFDEAPELWAIMREIARRAELQNLPRLHYTPSSEVNAFAVGSQHNAAIVLSHGLLGTLSGREIAGVLAHETAHVLRGDLRVMNLADYVSRVTGVLAMVGYFLLILSFPRLIDGTATINWLGLVLLAISPHFAVAVQMGLSRVREFDADQEAVRLTGDPDGLASALAKIDWVSRSWRFWMLPVLREREPSWLRTHPDTGERIRRLLALSGSIAQR